MVQGRPAVCEVACQRLEFPGAGFREAHQNDRRADVRVHGRISRPPHDVVEIECGSDSPLARNPERKTMGSVAASAADEAECNEENR